MKGRAGDSSSDGGVGDSGGGGGGGVGDGGGVGVCGSLGRRITELCVEENDNVYWV